MPNSPMGHLDEIGAESISIPAPQNGRRALSPDEVTAWLDEWAPEIARRWRLEVSARHEQLDPGVEELLGRFFGVLASFLPLLHSAHRDQFGSLFDQIAELYGHLGALRGLAAGEAVEEAQLLREVVFRFLYLHPPAGGRRGLALREFLQLSRQVDRLVTHAGIGHTDTLFFKLFQAAGVPSAPGEGILTEVRDQLEQFREEFEELRTLILGAVAAE